MHVLVEGDVHKVALCSSIPFSPCVLNVDTATSRYAAGTFEVQGPDQEIETILVIAVYLQVRNEAVAQAQAAELVSAAESTGLRYVIIGDFNLEQHQAHIGYAIQSGGTHACDSCEGAGNLPMTGPGRKRRIDFALAHWRLPAVSVQHRECHFSDHLVVRYDFLPNAPKARTGPHRRRVADRTVEQVDEFFLACQTQPVSQAIADSRIDEAWLLLSEVAEQCLCEAGANAVPGSEDWSPSPPWHHKKDGRRCAHQVWLAFAGCMAGCATSKPDLGIGHYSSKFDAWCRSFLCSCMKQLLLAYERQERSAILRAWQAKLKHEDHRIRSFVLSSSCYMNKVCKPGPGQNGVRHPAIAVQEQATCWTTKWNTIPRVQKAELVAMLQKVQRPPAMSGFFAC